mgnify:CR=1 FL=1
MPSSFMPQHRRDTSPTPAFRCGRGPSAGLGLAVRITPRSAMGIEGGIQHTWLEARDDPFSVVRVWDVGLIATLRF